MAHREGISKNAETAIFFEPPRPVRPPDFVRAHEHPSRVRRVNYFATCAVLCCNVKVRSESESELTFRENVEAPVNFKLDLDEPISRA
jgi:hypothetical protein